MRMLRPLILSLSALSATVAFAQAPGGNDRSRPNIVVIVADDLGYADLGAQGGSKDVRTPAIDSLAKNGVRFTSGYVSCPVCSPTRAGLLTGRYQQRFGHEFNPRAAAAGEEFGLPLTEKTLADRLKAAGYATGMVGKWHQGSDDKRHPLSRGFDEFFGFPAGAHSYIDDGTPNNRVMRGREPISEKEYLTDAFTREAVAFLDRHAKGDRPFFLYLAFNAIHTPMQAPEKYLARFPDVQDSKRRTMLAMLSALDDGISAVLARLRAAGVEENTLVFFVSDNGGPTRGNGSRNDPLRGFKGEVWEGGIRVPFMVQWKRGLPAGKVYDAPVIALDIHATALAAARAEMPTDKRLDGVDLIPYLTGKEKGAPHAALYWRFGSQWAIRKGDWKLVKGSGERAQRGRRAEAGGPAQLFNLAEDISEQKDLASAKPEIAAELQKEYDAWNAQLAKPLWGGQVASGGEGAAPRRANRSGARAGRARSRPARR